MSAGDKNAQGQADVPLEGGYHEYWNSAEKKGYSGVALFTKTEPQSVTLGLGIDEHDHEGRVITADYGEFYLVTVYTPNAQDGLKRLDYRHAGGRTPSAITCAVWTRISRSSYAAI